MDTTMETRDCVSIAEHEGLTLSIGLSSIPYSQKDPLAKAAALQGCHYPRVVSIKKRPAIGKKTWYFFFNVNLFISLMEMCQLFRGKLIAV